MDDDPAASSRQAATPPAGNQPTIIAKLCDGPLAGGRLEAAVVEGRPPKIIDVPDHAGACRYCLEDWVQTGGSAEYTFLYRT